jgi:3-dehydroquinate dehydratase type I
VKPRICVPLPAVDLADLIPKIRQAEDLGAHLIEIRLDYMDKQSLNMMERLGTVMEEATVPLIATNRQSKQGGHRLQDEEKRVQALIRAAEIGFQYVDVELTTAKLESTVQKARDIGAIPIVSFHDLKGTPAESELEKTLESEIQAGAEICKLVTTAKDVGDNIRCLLVTRRMSENTELVCFAMGKKGLLSRALSPFFGARFTFASLHEGLETASGQISITELKELYSKMGVNE